MMTANIYEAVVKHPIVMNKTMDFRDLLLVYVAVPTFLALIYALPGELQARLVLYFNHPGYLQLLTTNYVHQLYSHFQSNLIYYFICITLVISLESKRERFFAMLLVVFGLIPIVSSAASLLYYAGGSYTQVLGFSAVVSGLFGYMIYLMLEKLYQVTPAGNHKAYLVWIAMSILIIAMSAAALGVTEIYAVSHLSNGLGHLVGYGLGLIMAYTFRKGI